MTFRQEKRLFWDAFTTYEEMSPFFYADKINTPLLMYHFAEDDNSGTFVIQSERMILALTGLSKNAVLYVYPFDAHSPRCRENYLDLWARWLEWFDTYVKNNKSMTNRGTAVPGYPVPHPLQETTGVPLVNLIFVTPFTTGCWCFLKTVGKRVGRARFFSY